MILGQVTGTVISTQKDDGLGGSKLLIVQDLKLADLSLAASYVVAVDSIGAGLGDLVIVVTGSSARIASGMKEKPVDSAVIGIVDTIQLEGRVHYSKRGAVLV